MPCVSEGQNPLALVQGIKAAWPRQLGGSVYESLVLRKPDAPIAVQSDLCLDYQ